MTSDLYKFVFVHINKTAGFYAEYNDDETRQIVERLYAIDIAKFGCRFCD